MGEVLLHIGSSDIHVQEVLQNNYRRAEVVSSGGVR